MKTTVKVEGLAELDAKLGQLTKATAVNTLRRVLIAAATPMADFAAAKAPRDTGLLGDRISVSTKLSKGQARANRKDQDKSFAEVHVGPPASSDISRMVEFGTSKMAAQPYLRPAWDAEKNNALEAIKDGLGAEIDKATKRAARKAAKAAGG